MGHSPSPSRSHHALTNIKYCTVDTHYYGTHRTIQKVALNEIAVTVLPEVTLYCFTTRNHWWQNKGDRIGNVTVLVRWLNRGSTVLACIGQSYTDTDNRLFHSPTRNAFVSSMYFEMSTKISLIRFLASPNSLRGDVGDWRPLPNFLPPPSPASTAGWRTSPDIIDTRCAQCCGGKNDNSIYAWEYYL